MTHRSCLCKVIRERRARARSRFYEVHDDEAECDRLFKCKAAKQTAVCGIAAKQRTS